MSKQLFFWPLVVLLFQLWTFEPAFGHLESKCSYQPPRRNQVLPPVLLENVHHLRKRSIAEDAWGQLRVKIYYDNGSLNALSHKQQLLITEIILPRAVKFWSDALNVIQSRTPVRLHRKCQSNSAGEYKVHYPDPNNTDIFYCDKGCDPKTLCGDVLVPDEHLLQCLFLAPQGTIRSTQVQSKQISGAPDGPGVVDTDFILYVSTLETERCNVSKTVAYAAHCQQEMRYDRPIAGHANLCPHAITDDPSDIETILSTVKHEILHALGFSVALFAFFRDKDGQPLTPRDRYGRPPWSPEGGTYQWSEKTIRRIKRTGWEVRGGTIIRPMDMVVTPRVVEETRKYFNCGDVEGAELEDQGGEGTALTHWEKRVFENEAMTGVHTQNPVYSNITLALLEDSGWYRPDYSITKEVTFGAGLGCEFAMKSCKSWIDRARQNGSSPEPYCSKVKNSFSNNMIKTECSKSRSSLAICNLSPFSQKLPPQYQNFDTIPGIPDNQVPFYGGSVDLSDYCPFMQEFSWKGATGSVRGSRCSVSSNQPDTAMNFALEKYNGGSVCFEQDKAWTERTCQYTRTWQHWGSGCYEYSCTDGRLEVRVHNRSLTCFAEGQSLQLQILGDEWLHTGTIVCPSCKTVCERQGGFTCLADQPQARSLEKESWDYLQCRGSHSISSSVILAMVSLVVALLNSLHLAGTSL